MSKYNKSIVASGHSLVSEAAAIVLKEGGNAFDAVVAAGFASCTVEPALNSLGGGGLLLGHSVDKGQNLFFDFFVDTPGLGLQNPVDNPHFFPVTVQFSGSQQDFNVGLGAVAVPGTLKGLLHIHKRLGYMELSEVLAPAIEYAKSHLLNQKQAYFLKLLDPIMTLSPKGKEIYRSGGKSLIENNMLMNPELAAFIETVAHDGGRDFYNGDIARAIGKEMAEQDGLLTFDDLNAYEVKEKDPLRVSFRDYELFTSPAPSMGGALIGLSLFLKSQYSRNNPAYEFGSEDYLIQTTGLMQEVEKIRESGFSEAKDLVNIVSSGVVNKHIDTIRMFSRGTTHISIADKKGNCAAVTCSNGEGAGYFAPGTGVMLNNMMGEDDLHPEGFHSSPSGQRVGSMMSPSLLVKGDEVKLVIGSGGSKRIRTAVTQVLGQVVDFKRNLQESVDAPRLHWDGETVQMEPGFAADSVETLKKYAKVNQWESQGVYFGGVHAVIPGKEGAADKRRGGKVIEIS